MIFLNKSSHCSSIVLVQAAFAIKAQRRQGHSILISLGQTFVNLVKKEKLHPSIMLALLDEIVVYFGKKI